MEEEEKVDRKEHLKLYQAQAQDEDLHIWEASPDEEQIITGSVNLQFNGMIVSTIQAGHKEDTHFAGVIAINQNLIMFYKYKTITLYNRNFEVLKQQDLKQEIRCALAFDDNIYIGQTTQVLIMDGVTLKEIKTIDIQQTLTSMTKINDCVGIASNDGYFNIISLSTQTVVFQSQILSYSIVEIKETNRENKEYAFATDGGLFFGIFNPVNQSMTIVEDDKYFSDEQVLAIDVINEKYMVAYVISSFYLIERGKKQPISTLFYPTPCLSIQRFERLQNDSSINFIIKDLTSISVLEINNQNDMTSTKLFDCLYDDFSYNSLLLQSFQGDKIRGLTCDYSQAEESGNIIEFIVKLQ